MGSGKLCGFRCIVRTFTGHAKSMLSGKRNSRHELLGKMFMGIEIRKAVPLDAAAACALLRRSIEQGCEPDHHGRPEILDTWLANKNPDNVAAWFASPTNHAIVAERDGELLGLALLTQAGKLALCYVEPDALRIGVGRALLAAVEDRRAPGTSANCTCRARRAPPPSSSATATPMPAWKNPASASNAA